MSVELVPKAQLESDSPAAERVSPTQRLPAEKIYWELIKTNDRICPHCLGWRVRRDRAAVGTVEIEGGHEAEIAPDGVVEEYEVYPPRIEPAAARRATEDVPHKRRRATPPAVAMCECGDCDGAPPGARSREAMTELAADLARRLGEFGVVYDLEVLGRAVGAFKSNSAMTCNDDWVFEWATALSVATARGRLDGGAVLDGWT